MIATSSSSTIKQLNFALWCSTAGCGVSSHLLFDKGITEQVSAPLWFHVYFTVRRILFEIGGIQGPVSLPGDSVFSKADYKYVVISYRRICNDFAISHNTNFRFLKGTNNAIYAWFTNKGILKFIGLIPMERIYYFLMKAEKLAMEIWFHLFVINELWYNPETQILGYRFRAHAFKFWERDWIDLGNLTLIDWLPALRITL